MRWLARASLFDNPLFGGLIRALGSVPIERARLDRRGLQRASAIIEAGDSLVLFPEGTRGDGREVAVFERGYELLVRRARPTVVPVHLSGPERILPRKARWPRPAHCIVRVGEPFTADRSARDRPRGLPRTRAGPWLGADALRRAGLGGRLPRSARRLWLRALPRASASAQGGALGLGGGVRNRARRRVCALRPRRRGAHSGSAQGLTRPRARGLAGPSPGSLRPRRRSTGVRPTPRAKGAAGKAKPRAVVRSRLCARASSCFDFVAIVLGCCCDCGGLPRCALMCC